MCRRTGCARAAVVVEQGLAVAEIGVAIHTDRVTRAVAQTCTSIAATSPGRGQRRAGDEKRALLARCKRGYGGSDGYRARAAWGCRRCRG